jgi:hypothetical protein
VALEERIGLFTKSIAGIAKQNWITELELLKLSSIEQVLRCGSDIFSLKLPAQD